MIFAFVGAALMSSGRGKLAWLLWLVAAAQDTRDAGPLVVVGGSDGSGTRAVVSLLQQLGVPLAIDDPVSNDVHAGEVGGWPALVHPLLQAAHDQYQGPVCGMNFPPDPVRTASAGDLVDRTEQLVRQLVRTSREKAPTHSHAARFAGVVALKAPVAMALLPYFRRVSPDLRFIHVVRDGRDIAFSSNQSPVLKFFNASFGSHCWDPETFLSGSEEQSPQDNLMGGLGSSEAAALRGARLWSAWNGGLLAWLRGQQSSDELMTEGGLKFLVLRIEDLSTPECTEAKRRTIAAVAHLTGSGASDQELCCLCESPTDFLGASAELKDTADLESLVSGSSPPSSSPSSSETLASGAEGQGYGKWRHEVTKRPARLGKILEQHLQDITGPTLHAFDYQGIRAPATEEKSAHLAWLQADRGEGCSAADRPDSCFDVRLGAAGNRGLQTKRLVFCSAAPVREAPYTFASHVNRKSWTGVVRRPTAMPIRGWLCPDKGTITISQENSAVVQMLTRLLTRRASDWTLPGQFTALLRKDAARCVIRWRTVAIFRIRIIPAPVPCFHLQRTFFAMRSQSGVGCCDRRGGCAGRELLSVAVRSSPIPF